MVPRLQRTYSWGDDSGALQFVGLGLERATEFKVFEADLARSQWTELTGVGEDRVLFVQR